MIPWVASVLLLSAALWLLTDGGNRACRLLLSLTGLKEATAAVPVPIHSAGRVIGALERLILAIGFVAGSWEVVAAVVALKTVGRFKELDDKTFAEYFLVGSLFSLLWAAVVTGGWCALDASIGGDLAGTVRSAAA